MKNQDAFLSGYRLLKIPIVNEKGMPAWPEMFPLAKIEELQKTVGPRYFGSQMMLNPEPLSRARLDANALHFYNDDFDVRNAVLGNNLITGIALYWDPSSAHKNTDGSVCVMVLRDDKNKRAFIHECVYLTADDDDPHPLATQCGIVLDLMNEYEQKTIAIEVNGLGNALPEILRREGLLRDQTVVVQRIINHENKEKRILDSWEPLLGTGRLYAHERVRETFLIDELNDWTPSGWTHDDGLDAVAGALRTQAIPIHPRAKHPKTIKANTEFKI